MHDIGTIADAYRWAQEQPGSQAWLLANLLNALGSELPLTARTILGRAEHG